MIYTLIFFCRYCLIAFKVAMHRVGSAGNTCSSSRPRKEKRFTYVLNDADDKKVRQFFLILVIFSYSHDLTSAID